MTESYIQENVRILELRTKIKDKTYLKEAINRIAHVLSNKLMEEGISEYER